jgi:Fe-S-cluster containining protein
VADGKQPASVPCGSCTACCWYGRTDVKPEEEELEDLAALQMLEDEKGFYLAQRGDGGCIHLGINGGCEVWEHRPRVCRAYDCRVMGMAGLAPTASKGHTAPVWEFPIEKPMDRAILLAARIAALPYLQASQQGTPDPSGSALVAVLKGIYEHLAYARKLIASYDALPPDERIKFESLMQN